MKLLVVYSLLSEVIMLRPRIPLGPRLKDTPGGGPKLCFLDTPGGIAELVFELDARAACDFSKESLLGGRLRGGVLTEL